MSSAQSKIDDIWTLNPKAIEDGVHSKTPIIKLHAILAGAALEMKTEKFVAGVEKEAENMEDAFFGTPMRSFAMAALELLEIRQFREHDPSFEYGINLILHIRSNGCKWK